MMVMMMLVAVVESFIINYRQAQMVQFRSYRIKCLTQNFSDFGNAGAFYNRSRSYLSCSIDQDLPLKLYPLSLLPYAMDYLPEQEYA
jgi:hypothetical protein